jgi:flagellar biosynthesis protein FlhG
MGRDGSRAGTPWGRLLQLFRSGGKGPAPDAPDRLARVICVGSGKGGTGKSVLATNLAAVAAQEGLRTVLFDADLGLANAHLLLGVHPRWNLSHVLSGERSIAQVLEPGPANLRLACGGTGVTELAALDEFQLYLLASQIEELRRDHDLVVVDTAAGITPQTMVFLAAAEEVLLVTTRDVTALTDAYAVLKGLTRRKAGARVHIVPNRVTDEEEAGRVYERIRDVSIRFLERHPGLAGWIPEDPHVGHSIERRLPVVLCFPNAPAAEALRRLFEAFAPRAAPARPAAALIDTAPQPPL